MRSVFLIVVVLFVITRRDSQFTNGIYLFGTKIEDLMNITSDSNLLDNYCHSCKWVITLLRHYLNTGESEEQILKVGTTLCIKMKMQTPRVCEQGIHLFGAEIIKIAKRIDMTASDICYFFLDEVCIEMSKHETHKWNVSIPPLLKPKVTEIQLPKKNAHKLKVLHISDTHVDPLYVEGANADCNEPLCCRANDGMTNISFSAAKKWGEYRCDLPKRTLEHLLDHIAETHKVIEIEHTICIM